MPMTRSPNYGRGRKRPKHLRRMFLGGVERSEAGLIVTMLVDAPRPYAFRFPAADDTSAITKIELLRQGAWSVPVNEAAA